MGCNRMRVNTANGVHVIARRHEEAIHTRIMALLHCIRNDVSFKNGWLNQSLFNGFGNCFCLRVDVKLVVDVLDMCAYGLEGNACVG